MSLLTNFCLMAKELFEVNFGVYHALVILFLLTSSRLNVRLMIFECFSLKTINALYLYLIRSDRAYIFSLLSEIH
jgi:hypothetical protein